SSQVALLPLMCSARSISWLHPADARIGNAAPVLLTVQRVVQGMAVGGEWGGGVLLISENADPKRRGMLSALSQTGVGFGFVLSALVFAVVAAVTDEEQFLAWGWRVPFLLGALLMGAGLVIRLKV